MVPMPSLTDMLAAVRSLFDKGGDCVYVLVMGRTGAGKSSFINTATGSHLVVSSALTSQTRSIQLSRPLRTGSKRVILIDTPGLDDTSKSTQDVIWLVSTYLTKLRKRGITLHGAIYVHSISDNRMGQVALQSLAAFEDMCAQEALTNVAIVLNMWDDVSHDVRETRKTVLCERNTYFRPLIDAGAVACSHDRTSDSAHAVIQHLIRRAPQTASVRTGSCRQVACRAVACLPVFDPVTRHTKRRGRVQAAPTFRVTLNIARSGVDGDEGDEPLELSKHEKEGVALHNCIIHPTTLGAGCRPRLRRAAKAVKKFFRTMLLRRQMTA